MDDSQTHKQVRVTDDALAGPYIRVSEGQLSRVRSLLEANGVAHWVDHHVVSVDGKPAMGVVNLRKGSDVSRIQTLLDSAA